MEPVFKNGMRYRNFSSFVKERFGCRVFKISLNGGFTCPTRDGSKGVGGCFYCNPATLIPAAHLPAASIREQLLEGISYVKKRHRGERFIAYLQSYSSTYAPVEELESLYDEAVDHPDVVALAVSTRPDCVGEEVLRLLKFHSEHRFVWMEMGLQSSINATLAAINRGHTVEEFLSAYEAAMKHGIPVCVHVILGLPGESREQMMETARLLGRLKVWGVKLHHLQIHKGAPFEKMFDKENFPLLSFEEYASLSVEFLELLSPETVVHRLCGESPNRYLVAPKWGRNKFELIREIEELLEGRGTCQGAGHPESQIADFKFQS